MSVGIMILSVIAALGAALTSVVLGYGLWAALGFYILGGVFGVLSAVLVVVARAQHSPDPQMIESRV